MLYCISLYHIVVYHTSLILHHSMSYIYMYMYMYIYTQYFVTFCFFESVILHYAAPYIKLYVHVVVIAELRVPARYKPDLGIG